MARPRSLIILAIALPVMASYFFLAPGYPRSPSDLDAHDRFVRRDLPATAYLNDLGVADVNDDRWLDVYTTNHDVRPLILINDEGSAWADRVLELNLSTNRVLVGADKMLGQGPPRIDAPGIYIYWTLNEFVVQTHQLPESRAAAGVILAGRAEIATTEGSVVLAEQAAEGEIVAPFPADLVESQTKAFHFRSHGDSALRIHSYTGYNVARVHLSAPTRLQDVFIGSRRAPPQGRTFAIWPDDRHAMLWFDLNRDTLTDVVAVDGGMSGRSQGRVVAKHASYRPFLRADDGFQETALGGDLHHYGCPTRHASLVDFDRDGWLDIYVVCARVGGRYHNQLFRQTKPGEFDEVAAEVGLDLSEAGLSAWLDVDGDDDMDLFWVRGDELLLSRNDGGHFALQSIGKGRGRPVQLTLADFDSDGDFDIFVAAPHGSSLLINERGQYQIVDPQDKGLPNNAWCANWVDYDNDGALDLHALPGGLFRQVSAGSFEPTGLLAGEGAGQAFCTWFDFDNDGHRDFLVARADEPTVRERIRNRVAQMLGTEGQRWIAQNPALSFLEGIAWGHPFREHRRWHLHLYRNRGTDNHWLEVLLVGPDGNRPAIGARVTVETAAGTQTQQVGQAEGSLRSQGHYRAYFGLNDQAVVDRVRIAWPDGTREERRSIPSDQLLIIDKRSDADPRASSATPGGGTVARDGTRRE